MQNNYNNPYSTYYPNNNFNNYQQPRNSNLIFVNGIEGAKSYQVQPNQVVMLLDSDEPIVYKKTANGYGQATIEAYKMVSVEQHVDSEKYVLRADFEALVKRIDELTQKDGGSNA